MEKEFKSENEIEIDKDINRNKENTQAPVLVPADLIGPEAFHNLISEFILREGTDYGWQEVSFDKKLEQISKQILSGKVKIVFDPNLGSVTLMTERDWLKMGGDPRTESDAF